MRDTEQPIECWRCGVPIDARVFWKRVSRKMANPDECKDCRDTAKEQRTVHVWKHPTLGQITCKPYKGDLNDDWLPVTKDGRLYMPGERLCGLKDCVQESHVTKFQLVADPIETLLAICEAQEYSLRETPSRTNLKGATE